MEPMSTGVQSGVGTRTFGGGREGQLVESAGCGCCYEGGRQGRLATGSHESPPPAPAPAESALTLPVRLVAAGGLVRLAGRAVVEQGRAPLAAPAEGADQPETDEQRDGAREEVAQEVLERAFGVQPADQPDEDVVASRVVLLACRPLLGAAIRSDPSRRRRLAGPRIGPRPLKRRHPKHLRLGQWRRLCVRRPVGRLMNVSLCCRSDEADSLFIVAARHCEQVQLLLLLLLDGQTALA